ncbi:GIY-YIG nuclease family protein [Gimesia aquarii]|uniref:DUF4357 domain-containing protein n=1 Tax=Gimesia aquarii TaxID=2527964 RepID=A0A517WUW2_9PLAN|nr:GIY-YIG nuclease family protein [Gimesia aquarii]QDU09041.1 hypothetical protein V202x_24120 [Gimesia aquarii]
MSEQLGRTIQIYLPNGEPRGIRIAELTTRTVQTVLIPQSELGGAKKRPELEQIAVYFLFGEVEDQVKPIVYIGQTEDVKKRLDSHSNEKEFWKTAVLGISKTQAFTPAHIRWLEWYCIQRAKEVDRFLLDNEQNPREPFVTEPMQADLLDAFETLGILLTALGYPLFDPARPVADTDWFYCQGPEAQATGTLNEDGFLVSKDSLCRQQISGSASSTVSNLRGRLTESQILKETESGQFIFVQDFQFETPSGAAQVILGRNANGWVEWKNKEGKTLHEVKRAPNQAEEEQSNA